MYPDASSLDSARCRAPTRALCRLPRRGRRSFPEGVRKRHPAPRWSARRAIKPGNANDRDKRLAASRPSRRRLASDWASSARRRSAPGRPVRPSARNPLRLSLPVVMVPRGRHPLHLGLARNAEDTEMAVEVYGLENWALLALCGYPWSCVIAVRGRARLSSHAVARDLCATTWRSHRSHGAVAIATRSRCSFGVDCWLQPLPRAERRHVAWLSPASLAGALFGASLVPLIPGPWLLSGFAVTAVIVLCAGRPTLP